LFKRISILAVLGLVIGGIVAVVAVGFVEAVLALNDALLISPGSRAEHSGGRSLTILTIAVPTIGGLLVGLLRMLLKDRRFRGPSDAIRAAHTAEADMPVRSGIVSAVAACLSLGAGASVGQYGPLVHLGASIGAWLRRLSRAEPSIGNIGIACGAAAAISAAFHAPIAGLIFAREVILRHYSLRAFAPIAVASTVAYVIAHVVLQRQPLFQVTNHVVASAWEYGVFIGIGIGGALLALVYVRGIRYAAHLARQLDLPAPVKTALAGLALGITALQVPEVLGIGQGVLRHAMAGEVYGVLDLGVILVTKLLMTAICLGFGFAGGVFSPALLIGALFGALVGGGTEILFTEQHSYIAVYAVCGIVAVTGPVIGAPLTMVLIVFELTQNFDLAAAAMISVAFANLVGFRVIGRSLFDEQLRASGFDLSLGRDKVTAEQQQIRALLHENYTTAGADVHLIELHRLLVRDRRSEVHIVDDAGDYLGTLSLHRLMELADTGASPDDTALAHAQAADVTFTPDTSVWEAMTRMQGFVGESIPVLDDGRLVGALSEGEIVGAYLDIVAALRREEHAAG
jgi:CIC family chloride channel protein